MKQYWQKWISGLVLSMLVILLGTNRVGAAGENQDQLNSLIKLVENRYQNADFTVEFTQASTLKAMEITETAQGRLLAKAPGKMRWEYRAPDPQVIITDGENLWIHRPEDNQVMTGRAPVLFGSGKGAGFLADIQSLKKSFTITLAPDAGEPSSVLKLVPHSETPDLAVVYLTIDPATGEVTRVVSYNHYEDETRIDLTSYDFSAALADHQFSFVIPEDADILRLDQ